MVDPLQYQSAGALNYKILGDKDFLEAASKRYLFPLHVQISPTNKCNRNCTFCSFSDRERSYELSFDELREIIDKCKSVGTKAIDLTGGGEPTVYPQCNETIEYMTQKGIKSSLTTNGALLDRIDALDQLVWLRVSCSDSYEIDEKTRKRLLKVRQKISNNDWSLSYIVADNKYDGLLNLKKAVNLGMELGCSHIRIAGRITNDETLDNIDMNYIRKETDNINTGNMIVIVQDRAIFSPGQNCYAGFVRPRIEADGWIYACCSAQHSISSWKERRMPPILRICKACDIDKLPEMSCKPVNGNICTRCYLADFNKLLCAVMEPDPLHKEFI